MEVGNRCKGVCLPEESGFFAAVGHPSLAVFVRTSTERPDCVEENMSAKVVKIIQSYTDVVNNMVWRKD